MPGDDRRRSALEKAAELAPGLARRPESVAGERRPEDAEGRTWDERNRAVSLRIRDLDAARLAAYAQELGLSKDALGAALVWAALDALDAGALELEIETVQTEVVDKLDRTRIYVKRQARPSWQSGAFPEGEA